MLEVLNATRLAKIGESGADPDFGQGKAELT
jgi:hypothetical protein